MTEQASGISERGPVRDHDHEYFRLRPWIETATRQLVCESCDDVIDPGQEIIAYRDRGAMHLDCFDAEVDDA